ncbi:MAG: hypothetical protein ACF8AM_03640 [Rhodopirellula sp. JB055]|uniref:hypothetical protein n=1 Tax=Rhodopirellula sp. JB055 TaxID=3342846 RepID=UPI00370C106A
MGKSCIRFKKLDDLALDLIAEHLRGITASDYVASYIEKLKKGSDLRRESAHTLLPAHFSTHVAVFQATKLPPFS